MHRSLSGILLFPSVALTLAIVAITLPAQAQVSSPASAFPDRQPESISPDVASAFAKLIPLTTTASQEKMLKDEQAAWLASRNAHCRALAAAESGTGTANADIRAACLASMDKQRSVALQRMRISLLLALPRIPRSDAQRVAQVIRRDNAHTTYALHVSPIGGLAVAVTGADRAHNIYELYDLASGLALRTFAPERGSGLDSVFFSPNGRVLLTGDRSRRGLQAWEVHTGELLATVDEVWGQFVLSPEGRYVYFADSQRGLGTYDLIEGRLVGAFQPLKDRMNVLAVAPTGKRVAASAGDQLIVWDVRIASDKVPVLTQSSTAPLARAERPYEMAFSADGKSLLLATNTKRLERWSVQNLERQNSIWIAGTISSITRLSDTDRFVMRYTAYPGAVPDVLVYDLDRSEGTFLNFNLGGVYAVSYVASINTLLLALQSEIRATPAPASSQFRPLIDLFGAEPSRPAEVGGTSSPPPPTQNVRPETDQRQPERRVVKCGRTTFICDSSDMLVCNGRPIPCE
jgi:hypothetical protein